MLNPRLSFKSLLLISILFFSIAICWGQEKAPRTPDLRIKLRTFTFDPLEKMPTIPRQLRLEKVPVGPVYRIIQFKRSLTRKQTELLKVRYGLKLDQYISNFAYLEKVSQSQVDSLKKLHFFRWSGPYEPAYKISPTIGKRLDADEFIGQPFELNIILFPDADVASAKTKVEALGLEVLNAWDDPEIGIKRLKVKAVDLSKLEDLAGIPEIKWIEEFGRPTRRNRTTSWVIQTNVLNSRTVHAHGLHGEGQIVGHIDGELDIRHCFFRDPALDATAPSPGPAHRKVVAYRNSNGIPTSANSDLHGTHTAGILAGEDIVNAGNIDNGQAFAARISHAYDRDITGYGNNASNLLSFFTLQHNDGARIFSNSWGDDGTTDYTTWCEDIDHFMWANEDDLVILAVTNENTLRSPENAKNVLAVGATEQANNQNTVGSGGVGPTNDGRRKPDIFAPGCNINSSEAQTACNVWNAPSPPFVDVCGCSWACPAIAGAAAIVRQYYTEGWYPSGTKQPHNAFIPSGALIKATLLNGTVDMNSTPAAGAGNRYPSNEEGWGRLLLENSLYFDGDPINSTVWDVRHVNGLYSGESDNYHFTVATNTQPLKITLAWNEPPASAGSASPVINDLDLEVIGPDNVTTYQGNDINTNTGESNPNGGVIDDLNNVEMVILDTPPVGTYTLIVDEGATGINQGPQGYALVATADTEDPPVPTGDQNTLVVRVGMTGIPGVSGAAEPPLTLVQNIMTDVTQYFDDVSYGTVSIDPVYPNPVTLDHDRSYYFHPSRNLLIEMTEEVIDKLITADPDVFDRGTAATADDIDRMVIVLNDPNFIGDWATTGPWPYDLPGGLTRRISVSVQSVHNDPERRFAHGLGHHFGLVDLYAHPNVIFAQPHVDEWDLMAMPLQRCGFMTWSKERAAWITTHGSSIEYIPRPGAGASYNNTLGINFLSSTNQDRKTIAIGLTEGAANLEDEDVFYYVEARTNTTGDADNVLPEEGVLLYYVNENIRQGEGPVRIIDDDLGTLSLSDAALETGDSKSPAGTGLQVEVQAGTGTADRNIQISYDPPETDNDVNIRVGDPAYTSPDIWVDSQKDGFDEDMGRTPMDRGDQPVTGEVNRIYFRVHNPGPGDAYDFTIFIRVSEPYHTVGGKADFNVFVGQIFITRLEAGKDTVDYVEWTPVEDGDPHTCAWVEIPNVFNDVNINNNTAQQNLQEVPSSHGSPYEIVTYRFGFSNPEDDQELFYFRAEGVPEGWVATLNPRKALLSAYERIECTLTIQPPNDAPVCTEHRISVTSWMPRGNTLIQVGGGMVQVDLRNRTDLTLEIGLEECSRKYMSITGYVGHAAYHQGFQQTQACMVITAQGCTNPPRPYEEIIVRYEDPSGYPIYRTVITDEFGCYSDFYVVAEGGVWEVTAEYPGNDCDGPAATPAEEVSIPLPQTGDQDGDRVPDSDEPQGDHDRDDIPGIFDVDSDNDGIPDGDEPPGDLDRDGHDNIVDPDSDNDGKIDGQDPDPYGVSPLPKPRKFLYSFHVGSAHPLGDLDSLADANIHVRVDLNYTVTDKLSLMFMAGLSQFTAESFTGIDHPRWANLSANIKGVFPAPSGTGLRYYLQTGPGYYIPKAGSNEFGFNLGAGGQIPIGNWFDLEFGVDYHHILTDDPTRFLTVQLGALFR
jgi:M6 family metalloprotease-like protein